MDISNELGPLGVSDRLYFPGFASTLSSLLPRQVEEKGLLTVVHDKSVSGDYALQRVPLVTKTLMKMIYLYQSG
jgi:hypothetical protein